MATARRLVLENRLGQGIRVLNVAGDRMNLIFRHDNRRVEAHSDLSALKDAGVKFDVLSQLSASSVTKDGFALPHGLGRIKAYDADTKITHASFELPEENDEQRVAAVSKKTAITHAVAVVLLIVLGFFMSPAKKEIEPQLVTIEIPKEVKKQVVATVKPATKPMQHKMKVAQKPQVKKTTVRHAVAKVKPPKIVPRSTVSRYVYTPKPRSLDNVGALAALGGLRNGHKGSQGLDMNSMRNIRAAGVGAGGGGVGSGSGGITGVMPGTGLIAGSSGRGARGESAGGYGTRGYGGGRAGYGTISMVGGSGGGIALPADEDASVGGGLTMDQIRAVINRNMGQIIYCYEQGLPSNPNLAGRVTASWIINGAGRVTALRVSRSSLKNASVEGCIVSKMKTWQFPRPEGGVNVDVEYPFDLRRLAGR